MEDKFEWIIVSWYTIKIMIQILLFDQNMHFYTLLEYNIIYLSI